MQGENLIFLISQPRSGSTLLQKVLSNHSDIATTSEPWVALPIFYKTIFENVKIKNKVAYNGKSCQIAIQTSLNELPNHNDIIKRGLANLYENLCNEHCKVRSKKMFLDKTPRYYFIIDELRTYYPKSKIIILYRNPLSVLSSILKTWVKTDLFFLSYYKDDLLFAPKVLAKYRDADDKNILSVSYEEFVNTPELNLRKICTFLNIEFSNEMLNLGVSKEKWKFGDPENIYKKKSVDNSNLNQWSSVKKAQHWRLYFEYLSLLGKPIISQLGYSYEEIETILLESKPDKLRLFFTISFLTATARIANMVLVPLIKLKRAGIKKAKLIRDIK